MPGHSKDLTRLRIALTTFFALDGFIFAGWVVRIPAIKEQTGASASTLGLALLGVSAGAVVTMMFTGRLCRRYGSHPVTVVCGILLSLSVALPPLTHSTWALGAVLLVFGAAYGGINVAFNSAAVDLVAVLRRPTLEQRKAQLLLEAPDLARQGRLGNVQQLGGPRDGAVLRHGDERFQPPQVHTGVLCRCRMVIQVQYALDIDIGEQQKATL